LTLLETIASDISRHGYFALFAVMMLEGPLASVAGAFLAAAGLLRIEIVFALALLGDLAGDALLYAIGRYSRMAGCCWHWQGISRLRPRLQHLKLRFHTHPGRILIAGKLTHAAGFLVLLAAGAARLPFLPFLGFNLLATLPKASFFLLLGYFAGAAYRRIDFYLWLFSCLSFALIAAGCIVFVRRRLKSFSPEE
jgi:membrane protein DedA with SNARE-associated domain